jgi:hypothetical protein
MVGHRLINFNEFMVKKENRMPALNALKNLASIAEIRAKRQLSAT